MSGSIPSREMRGIGVLESLSLFNAYTIERF